MKPQCHGKCCYKRTERNKKKKRLDISGHRKIAEPASHLLSVAERKFI